MVNPTGLVALAAITPIIELRGGIPYGIAMGMNPFSVFLLAVVFNALVFLPVYFGMKFLYKGFFSKINLFNKYLKRTRTRGKPYIDRYGVPGLLFFVAVPLPMTGAYTGAFLAWLMNLEWKKSFAIVTLGVTIAGLVVLGASLGAFKLLI